MPVYALYPLRILRTELYLKRTLLICFNTNLDFVHFCYVFYNLLLICGLNLTIHYFQIPPTRSREFKRKNTCFHSPKVPPYLNFFIKNLLSKFLEFLIWNQMGLDILHWTIHSPLRSIWLFLSSSFCSSQNKYLILLAVNPPLNITEMIIRRVKQGNQQLWDYNLFKFAKFSIFCWLYPKI